VTQFRPAALLAYTPSSQRATSASKVEPCGTLLCHPATPKLAVTASPPGTPGKGVAVQYRPAPGASSIQAANVAGAAPAWVRLSLDSVAAGNFTASWSINGFSWTVLGTVHVPFAGSEFYIGLPVTSHNAASSASAVFDAIAVTGAF